MYDSTYCTDCGAVDSYIQTEDNAICGQCGSTEGMTERFEPEAIYTIANGGAYHIQTDEDVEYARVRLITTNKKHEPSGWLPIEMVEDEEGTTQVPIIDPEGFHIDMREVSPLINWGKLDR